MALGNNHGMFMTKEDLSLFKLVGEMTQVTQTTPVIFDWTERKIVLTNLLTLKGKIIYNIHVNNARQMPGEVLDAAFNLIRHVMSLAAFCEIEISTMPMLDFDDIKLGRISFCDALCDYTYRCAKLLLAQKPASEKELADNIMRSFLDLYKVYSFIVLEQYNIDFYGAMTQEIEHE